MSQEPQTRGRTMGVSGPVQFDLDIECFSEEHEGGERMMPTEEFSDNNNPVPECPECGIRRAASVHVAPLK